MRLVYETEGFNIGGKLPNLVSLSRFTSEFHESCTTKFSSTNETKLFSELLNYINIHCGCSLPRSYILDSDDSGSYQLNETKTKYLLLSR